MGIRIDQLPTAVVKRNHLVPAMSDAQTVRLSVAQILSSLEAEDLQGLVQSTEVQIHGAASKSAVADADEVGLADSAASWGLKKFTLANLISSIFKTTRTIANAQFAAASFKLFNGAGTPRALTIDPTAMTADRKITMPDGDVDLGRLSMIWSGETWQVVTRTANTIYQNTTGKFLPLSANSTGNGLIIDIANNASLTGAISFGYNDFFAFSIVPPGWYYRVKINATVSELRA